jgi:hypothetical protein
MFLFYLLFYKGHFVGYFSKQKSNDLESDEDKLDDDYKRIKVNGKKIENKIKDENKRIENDEKNKDFDGLYKKNQNKTNLSCIVILPAYQKMGFAQILVDMSYELGRFGSPERPLSKDGLKLYKKYWCDKVLESLKNEKEISILEIVEKTGICVEDVVFAMEVLGFIKRGVVDFKMFK